MSEMENIVSLITNSGEILKKSYYRSFSYNEKGKADLVSETDLEIEDFLINGLKAIDADCSIYSEESGEAVNVGKHRWLIDPIDGTANFIFGVPYFNISVSLEAEGNIVEAYVYSPVSEELYFTGRNDEASYLNGETIRVSETCRISDSLVVFGFSANFENIKKYYEDWRTIFVNCRKGMGLLSPALNICNVARGRTDCFIDFGSSMEGHAGAALILRKAGGICMNYDGSLWDHARKGVVACSPGIVNFLR